MALGVHYPLDILGELWIGVEVSSITIYTYYIIIRKEQLDNAK